MAPMPSCGLDVEIVPGGPQANNRMLLPVGRIDFYMGGNLIQAFSAIREEISHHRRRRELPERPADPDVASRPGDSMISPISPMPTSC